MARKDPEFKKQSDPGGEIVAVETKVNGEVQSWNSCVLTGISGNNIGEYRTVHGVRITQNRNQEGYITEIAEKLLNRS
jgi:hypothetical protein